MKDPYVTAALTTLRNAVVDFDLVPEGVDFEILEHNDRIVIRMELLGEEALLPIDPYQMSMGHQQPATYILSLLDHLNEKVKRNHNNDSFNFE